MQLPDGGQRVFVKIARGNVVNFAELPGQVIGV